MWLTLLTAALMAALIGHVCQWDTNKQLRVQLDTYQRRIHTLNAALEKAARDYNQVVKAYYQVTGSHPGGNA